MASSPTTMASFIASVAVLVMSAAVFSVAGIGMNWGNQASHILPPDIVVRMLKDNGIDKVKLFDADPWTVGALRGSGIEVMLGIPNDQLKTMTSYDKAVDWVKKNVTKYDSDGSVKIKYVAVGNEPFLKAYNGSFLSTTFPAVKNIQKALDEAGVGSRIKATIPLNADVYGSPASNPNPSGGDFRSDIKDLMVQIVKFLNANNAPFTVNIYPFLSLYQNVDFPVDYAFFDGRSRSVSDGNVQYTNVFDANFDTLVIALKKAKVPNLKIIVGEAGWPTDGDKNANPKLAKRFYEGFLKKMAKKEGTPLRPGYIEAYLFGLLDEDLKSIQPGDFERHWGIFTYDGKPKFPMDLSGKGDGSKYLVGAKGVQYLPDQWCVYDKDTKAKASLAGNIGFACSQSDCTQLGYGSSCNNLDKYGNMSFAFNMYFQMQDQDVRACDFQGLAKIVEKNASTSSCLFPVQIVSSGRRVGVGGFLKVMVMVIVGALVGHL